MEPNQHGGGFEAAVIELVRSVGRIEGIVQHAMLSIDAHGKRLESIEAKHDERITALEARGHITKGYISAVMAIGTGAVGVVSFFLEHWLLK